MKKQGFTLIELVVSIVLVSIILVTLVGSLLQLRSAYSVVHENSDVIVYTSSISRVINSDINDNNGIKFVSCETDGKKCSLILGNDDRRELVITDNDKIIDDTELGIEHSNNKTTLKYLDTTKYDKTNNENDKKLIYIRTLEIDKYDNSSSGVTTTNGYGFYDMSATQYEYYESGNDNNIDAFTTITIRLLDGINMDVSKYDITLYGAGRYDYNSYVGRVYRIDLDNSEADTSGTTSIDEVFAVGYFIAESPHRKQDKITKIEIPTKGSKAFLGYYYKPYGVNVETKVIDSGGNIVASSRVFKNDVKLNEETTGRVYAKWGDCENGFKVENGKCVQAEYTVILNRNQSGKTCNSIGTTGYQILYQNLTPDIVIPQCEGYTFEGYLSSSNKQYHNRDGIGVAYYDIPSNATFNASWAACEVGQYSLMNQQTCTDCIKGSYAGSSASGKCVACQNGKTTNGNKQASCNANCPNNNIHVATWKTAVWNENNTVTNDCQINTCKTGYDGEIASNKCTVNTYKIAFNLNGGTLDGVTSPSTRRVDYDTTETINNPTRAGYEFTGWTFNGKTNTAMHGGLAWSNQNTKVKDTTFKNLTPKDEETVTLTANWSGCGPGYYNDGTSTICSACPAGSISTGNANTGCTLCGAGKWAPGGTNTCGNIDAGCYGTSASSSCPNQCNAGTYSTAGSASCSDCDAGSYSGNKAGSCTACGAGKWSGKKSSSCSNIDAGCYGTSASSSCPNECQGGTYSTAGSASCSECDAGRYSGNKAGSCTPCGAGKWAPGGTNTCSNIDAGCYGTSAGSSCPDECSKGTYSSSGASSCTNCPSSYPDTSSTKSTLRTQCRKSNSCTKTDANHNECNVSGNYSNYLPCTKTDCNHNGCNVSGTYSTCSGAWINDGCRRWTGTCYCNSTSWNDIDAPCSASTCAQSCKNYVSDSYSWSGSCSCADYYQHYDRCATGSSSNTCYKSNANHDGCSCSGNYVSSTPSCTKTDANHDGCSVTGTYYTYSD